MVWSFLQVAVRFGHVWLWVLPQCAASRFLWNRSRCFLQRRQHIRHITILLPLCLLSFHWELPVALWEWQDVQRWYQLQLCWAGVPDLDSHHWSIRSSRLRNLPVFCSMTTCFNGVSNTGSYAFKCGKPSSQFHAFILLSTHGCFRSKSLIENTDSAPLCQWHFLRFSFASCDFNVSDVDLHVFAVIITLSSRKSLVAGVPPQGDAVPKDFQQGLLDRKRRWETNPCHKPPTLFGTVPFAVGPLRNANHSQRKKVDGKNFEHRGRCWKFPGTAVPWLSKLGAVHRVRAFASACAALVARCLLVFSYMLFSKCKSKQIQQIQL